MKYILFLFLFIANLGFAQVRNQTNMKEYISDETTEKIILHTDRGLYLSGEKIWFNAYCFIPEKTASNNLSNILYVELYNGSREFITKRKFQISKDKNVYGSIDIPSEFLSGNYYLRAYTQFLKNQAPESYFTSIITIINPLLALPERAEVKSKVNIDSVLIEDLKIKSIVSSNDQLRLEITNHNYAFGNYTLSIWSEDAKIIVERSIQLIDETTQIVFPANILGKGLNHIILKDKQNTILKIAAVYNKQRAIEIKLSTQKQNYAKRELVNLDITNSFSNAQQLTNISVSVVKKGLSNNALKLIPHIIQRPQLFNSFLQNPNNTYAMSQEQMDQLMTQYNQVLAKGDHNYLFIKNNLGFKWLPEIRDVSISGIVYNKADKTPIPNLPVYVSVFNENPQVHIYKTRQNGGFIFSLNNLEDDQDIYLSTKPYPEAEIEIQILNDFSHDFPKYKDIPLAIDTMDQFLLEDMYINMQAGEIFKTKTGSNVLSKISIAFNLGRPDITTVLDDYVSSPTLESIIEEITPNIRVRRKKGKALLSIFDTEKHIYYEDPLALVDYIPIFNIDDLLKIPPAKIIKIDIYKKPLIIGNELINGIFMVSTNTEDFGGVKTPEGSVFLKYKTNSLSYGFDPPIYDTEEKQSKRLADFRNLLYWNPSLSFSQETTVSFYSSDYYSEYDIIVRGYTSDGQECFGKTSINVEANN